MVVGDCMKMVVGNFMETMLYTACFQANRVFKDMAACMLAPLFVSPPVLAMDINSSPF